MLKQIVLTLFTLISANLYAQITPRGWFSVADETNKTLYITAIQEIPVGDKNQWAKVHFEAGFLKLQGWENVDRREHRLFSTLEFEAYGFEKFCVSKREKLIERCKSLGFNIVEITLPTPIPVDPVKAGVGSKQ